MKHHIPRLCTLTPSELQALIIAARASGPDDELFLRLQAQAGLRTNELSTASAVTLNPGETILYIRMKTLSGMRHLQLQGGLLALVGSCDFTFRPSHPTAANIWTARLAKIARSVNVRASARSLRASYATYRLAQTFNLNEIAGEIGVHNPGFYHTPIMTTASREEAENWFSL